MRRARGEKLLKITKCKIMIFISLKPCVLLWKTEGKIKKNALNHNESCLHKRPYLEFRLWYSTTAKGNVSWDPPCRFFPQRENLLLAPTVAEALNWDEKKRKKNFESQQRGYWGGTWDRCKERKKQWKVENPAGNREWNLGWKLRDN